MEYPKRKANRLKDYDYSQNGLYFVTVCTYNRRNLFGVIRDGKMILNGIGDIVDYTLRDLVNHNDMKLHKYVIMPDHIHAIAEISNRRERSVTVPHENTNLSAIPEIIRQFKTFSSRRINDFLKRNGYEPFPTGRLWQKSYYDHIIRDENDYLETWRYIENNPMK